MGTEKTPDPWTTGAEGAGVWRGTGAGREDQLWWALPVVPSITFLSFLFKAY